MYGPYDLRLISMDAFLTPVFTARMYGRQKVHPYIYGPYIWPVQVTRKIPEYIFANIT